MYNSTVAPTIDITIPVLNESLTLRSQIEKLQEFLMSQSELIFTYQITIADNGSSDSTLSLAKELAEKFKNIRVVTVGKRGVGLALKSAWTSSRCDYIGYMDLDFSTDLFHLLDMEKYFLDGYECVFGSRLLPGSRVVGRTLKREITSRVFNRIIRTTFGTSMSDGMCGFKFLRRELLSKLLETGAESDGWFFGTEIVVTANLANFYIHEIPVSWHDDADSKVKIPSLTLEYIRDILKFRKRINFSDSQPKKS